MLTTIQQRLQLQMNDMAADVGPQGRLLGMHGTWHGMMIACSSI